MAHILVKQVFREFDEWLAAFKANAAMRREYGSQGAVVFRNPGNPNEVLIFFTWDSVDNANRYATASRLSDVLDTIEAGIPLLLTEAYEVEA